MNQSDAILARFQTLHPKRMDLSLGRLTRLLEALGHPERRLPPVFHVAGTNGKGSTVAFLRAALEAAGHGVHVYTSPHLVRFHERIRLAHPEGTGFGSGRLVDEATLADAMVHCERVNAGEPITFFEITTAVAFHLFATHPADAVLLEVGLGGRLDATNVVDRPLVTGITSVSLDHSDFLGGAVEGIAAEKAGILKRGVPGIIGPQSPAVRAVIEEVGSRVRAPLVIAGQDFEAREENGRLVYQDEAGLLDLALPRLAGRHQHRNAGVAIAMLRAQGVLPVPDEAIERAMATVDWPARLQRLTSGRIPALLPEGSELWLDGGHNEDGGRVLAEALAEFEERRPRPLVLVVGMLSTKDSDGFLQHFAGLARRVHAVPIEHSDTGRPPEAVAAAAIGAGLPAEPHPTLSAALAAIRDWVWEAPPRVVITGSLYLAGEVLAFNGTELK